MDTIGSSFTAEELEFCISALQLQIEDIERDLNENKYSKDERIELTTYIKKLDEIQDQFLLENNAFKSADLLQVSDLVEKERDYLNTILDQDDIVGEMRKEAQRHLRTADPLLPQLKKYFQSFDITV